MKKRLILIDPPGLQKGINTGLAYLSAILTDKDIHHLIVDMNNYDYGNSKLLELIDVYSPDLIGYSIKTATYHSAVGLIEKLRKNFPHIIHFVGGPHITLFYDEFLKEIDSVDFGIIGDAEIAIANLCDSNFEYKGQAGIAYKEDGGTLYVPQIIPLNLDEVPFPSFDKFLNNPLERFPYPLVTSRGCPYSCIYCSVGNISGRRWRYRSPEHVIKELNNAREKYQVASFDIIDDTFTQNIDRAITICDLLIRDKIGFSWGCPNGIRVDRISEKLVQSMKQAGCHTVMFGIESGDPEIFKSINKGERLSDVASAIKITKKAGLKVGGFFIIGLPGDSLDKTKKSLKFAKEVGLDWAHFNMLSPYPKTEVWDIIKRHGRFFEDYKCGRHFIGKPNPVFEINGFTRDQMIDAYLYVHTYQDLFSIILSPDAPLKEQVRQAIEYAWKYDKSKIIRYISWKKNILFILRKALPRLKLNVKLANIKKNIHIILCDSAMRYRVYYLLKSYLLMIYRKLFYYNKGQINIERLRHGRSGMSGDNVRHLNILHINDYCSSVGGTEVYLSLLCKALKSRGCSNTVAYGSHDGRGDLIHENCLYLPFLTRIPGNESEDKKTQQELKELINRANPDIIYLHNVTNPETINTCISTRPAIRFFHDHRNFCLTSNRLLKNNEVCKQRLGKLCIKSVHPQECASPFNYITAKMYLIEKQIQLFYNLKLDHAIVASHYMKQELIEHGFPSDRITINPYFTKVNCVDNGTYGSRVILAIGRIVSDKGFDLLLDALHLIEYEDFKLIFIGDGPALSDIKQKIGRLGLQSKVEFKGWLDREEVHNYLTNCQFVVVPSLWPEPFGIVGIEAMACKKPVIAFAVGGIGDWLKDKYNGLLIEPGNVYALSKAIKLLLSSPEYCRNLGLNGYSRFIEEFSEQGHIDRLISVFNEAINNVYGRKWE